jgi:MscS family membrane protein
MDPDFPPRVYFNEFNADSFNIRIMYWYTPPNYWDFLAFSQRVNYEICRAFEEQGVDFSLPNRVTHVDLQNQNPFEFRLAAGQLFQEVSKQMDAETE